MLLMVENDRLGVRPWIEILRDEYEIEVRNHADRALTDLSRMPNLRSAILDVMMPAPGDWGNETLGGTATELVLAQKLGEISTELPIIFVTAIPNLATLTALKNCPEPSKLLLKLHLRPGELLSAVREMTGGPDSDRKQG